MFPSGSYTSATTHHPLYSKHLPIFRKITEANTRQLHTHSGCSITNSWLTDSTVLMTLFAILKNQPESNSLQFAFEHNKISLMNTTITAMPANQIPTGLVFHLETNNPNRLHVRIVHVAKGMDLFEHLDTIQKQPHLKDLKHVSLALQENRYHKIRVYFWENKLLVVTNIYTWELLRKLIALLPRISPLFTMTPFLEELLRAFGTNDYNTWTTLFTTWFITQKFHLIQLKTDLIRLINSRQERRLTTLQDNINGAQRDIRENENYLLDVYTRLQNYQQDLYNLQLQPDLNAEEFFDYLQHHKQLTNIRVINDVLLHLNIVTPLIYYDKDALAAYYKRTNDTLAQATPRTRQLLHDIFIAQKYNLFTETSLYLDFAANEITRTENEHLQHTAPPQPHLMQLNCFGNNGRTIRKHLVDKKYIEAIEQTVAATQNINFVDTSAVRKLIGILNQWTESIPLASKPILQHPETLQMFSLTRALAPQDTPEEEIPTAELFD